MIGLTTRRIAHFLTVVTAAAAVAACHKEPMGPHYVSNDVTGKWSGTLASGVLAIDVVQSGTSVQGTGSFTPSGGKAVPVTIAGGGSITGEFVGGGALGNGAIETDMTMHVFLQPAARDYYQLSCLVREVRSCVGQYFFVPDIGDITGPFPVTLTR